MRTYPIMLDLRGRLAVVVGGGRVGLRKAQSLRDAGARVRLVSPQVAAEADLDGIDLLSEAYRANVLAGAALVFACTDDVELNRQVARDARQIGALVNVADTPAECDFYLAATLRDGDVVVAVGSGGAAPALAAWLKRRIADRLPERLGAFAAVLEELRTQLKAKVPDGSRRMELMRQLVSDGTHEAFLQDGPEAVRARLLRLLEG